MNASIPNLATPSATLAAGGRSAAGETVRSDGGSTGFAGALRSAGHDGSADFDAGSGGAPAAGARGEGASEAKVSVATKSVRGAHKPPPARSASTASGGGTLPASGNPSPTGAAAADAAADIAAANAAAGAAADAVQAAASEAGALPTDGTTTPARSVAVGPVSGADALPTASAARRAAPSGVDGSCAAVAQAPSIPGAEATDGAAGIATFEVRGSDDGAAGPGSMPSDWLRFAGSSSLADSPSPIAVSDRTPTPDAAATADAARADRAETGTATAAAAAQAAAARAAAVLAADGAGSTTGAAALAANLTAATGRTAALSAAAGESAGAALSTGTAATSLRADATAPGAAVGALRGTLALAATGAAGAASANAAGNSDARNLADGGGSPGTGAGLTAYGGAQSSGTDPAPRSGSPADAANALQAAASAVGASGAADAAADDGTAAVSQPPGLPGAAGQTIAMAVLQSTAAAASADSPAMQLLDGSAERRHLGGGDAIGGDAGGGGVTGGANGAANAPGSGGFSLGAPSAAADTTPVTLKLTAGLDSAQLPQALAERVAFLAGNDLTSAKLQVNPPQLGPIDLQISVQGDHAQILMSTHSAVTREALESSVPRLRDLLGAQGFAQVSVDVSQRSFQERPALPRPYEALRSVEAGGPDTVSSVSAAGRVASSLIDAYA